MQSEQFYKTSEPQSFPTLESTKTKRFLYSNTENCIETNNNVIKRSIQIDLMDFRYFNTILFKIIFFQTAFSIFLFTGVKFYCWNIVLRLVSWLILSKDWKTICHRKFSVWNLCWQNIIIPKTIIISSKAELAKLFFCINIEWNCS